MQYRVISTDDHLQEAPHTWTARMSKARWGNKIPQIVRQPDGTDMWCINGEKRQSGLLATVHGAMPDRTKPPTRWEDVPKCTYVPAERLKAMEQDGVDVHTFFGNIAGIAGNTFSAPNFDEEFRLECIRAFNDYQIEEWARPYPGRFITLANLPLWDVQKAVTELERTAKLGISGISVCFPQQWGYPHISDQYWDPLWRAAVEHNLSANFHIGGGGGMGFTLTPAWEGQSAMFRLAEGSVRAISANTQVMGTLLFSGIMERHPKLKIVSSESGLGWAPYLLETADHQWDRQALYREGMTKKPSEYFRRQCYVNFWYEVVGIEMRNYIGVDNIMWESDFPHPTCTYPTSQDYIERALAKVTPAERQKILVDNAIKVYNLPMNGAKGKK